MNEWAALNSVVERDLDAVASHPWYPYLFIPGMSMGVSVNVYFATEAECWAFIRDEVLTAKAES